MEPKPTPRPARRLRGVASLTVLGLALAPLATGAGPRPGQLDTTFGGSGKVRTDFSGGSKDQAYSVVVQGDGKVVAAGTVDTTPGGGFALARYSAGGALDTAFDGDGKVRTSFAPTSTELGYALALQADGKYVVAGVVGIPGSGTASDFALARYNPDGTLDVTFDGDGKVITDFENLTDQAYTVAIQADGKIIAGGTSRSPFTNRFDYALARYNADGTLDTSFSGDGKVRFGLGGTDEYGQAVVIQPDGRIILGGVDTTNGAGVVLRFMPDGAWDTSFGTGGVVYRQGGSITDVELQADGKILFVGDPGFSVTRLNPDGSVDTAFSAPLAAAGAYSLIVQPDGNIVAAGTLAPGPGREDFALARFRPNGELDASFGTGGTVVTDLGGPTDVAYSVAAATGGKLLVAGTSMPVDQTTADFALARYVGELPPCKVPNVRGKKLGVARASIVRAGCRVGKVTRKRSKRVKKGRVISQSPRAGARVPAGGKVNLVVSKSSKRR
jgi:uncharacterized delta-60 repeat protein